jgi:hypothetical protein
MTIARISHISVETKIFVIRSEKVMLDRDLAELYGVETFFCTTGAEAKPVVVPLKLLTLTKHFCQHIS